MSEFKPPNDHPPAGQDIWTTIAGAEMVNADFGSKAIRLPGVTVSIGRD